MKNRTKNLRMRLFPFFWKGLGVGCLFITFAFSANAQKIWTLQDCIEYAKEHNLTVQMQNLNQEKQKINVNSAKNRRLPNLNASMGQNWSFGRGASPIDNSYQSMNSSSSSLSASTSIPLFTGFQIPAQIDAAKLNLQATIADFEAAKENVELAVISAYLQVLYNKDLVEIQKNQVELSRLQLERVQTMFDLGKASQAQVAEIKAQIANDELSLTQTQNDKQISLLTLSQLLELESPEGFDIADLNNNTQLVMLANPNEIYTNALTTRANIRAEEYRLKSSEKYIKVARSGYWPQLSFGAGYGNNYYRVNGRDNTPFSDQIKNNENKYFGFSLNIPIFDRFETRNNIRSAKLDMRNQQLQLENTKKTLYKEIQQAHYNAVAAFEQYKASQTALESSQTAFNFVKEKFENGRATTYELSDAKTALSKASVNLSQAKYNYIFRKKILDFYNGTRNN